MGGHNDSRVSCESLSLPEHTHVLCQNHILPYLRDLALVINRCHWLAVMHDGGDSIP